MFNVKNFQPIANSTVNAAVAVTVANLQIQCVSGRNNSVRVFNGSTGTVFINFLHTASPSAAAATTAANGMPIGAGLSDVFQVGVGENGIVYLHFIAPSGTGNIYATPGEGS